MSNDDFDIDIYGDADDVTGPEATSLTNEDSHVKQDSTDSPATVGNTAESQEHQENDAHHTNAEVKNEIKNEVSADMKTNNSDSGAPRQIPSTDESGHHAEIPKQAPQQQGLKRKESSDDRPIDPLATSAIQISELQWWAGEEHIRGYANQAKCEDELVLVSFSEHKVNGKSKGVAYVRFKSQQAATAMKHKIDSFAVGQQSYAKKLHATYANPNIDPFHTLPKDAPAKSGQANGNNFGNQRGGFNSNYRGGRGGGYNNRGNMGGGGYQNRNNFNANGMGMNAGFQNPVVGGFQPNMGNQFANGGFNNGGYNRGGMGNQMRGGMGGRGGRGGMNNMMGGMGGAPMMPGMPMNGMPMNGPMGGSMMGGMPGGGFPQMQPHFNPAFFPGQPGLGPQAGGWSAQDAQPYGQNPHGAKRPRPE